MEKNWHPPRYLKSHHARSSSKRNYITEKATAKVFSIQKGSQNIKVELVTILKKEKIDTNIVGAAYLSLKSGYADMCKELDKAIAEKRQHKKEEKHVAEHKEKISESAEGKSESEEKSGKTANKSMVPSSSSSEATTLDGFTTMTRDAADVAKGILKRFNRPAESKSTRKTMATKGGGDCALHAILGGWSDEHQQIECESIKEAREEIYRAILNCKKKY